MPTFADIALAKIDKLLVQSWVRDLVAKGLHPSTIKECYRMLRGVMNEAADARLNSRVALSEGHTPPGSEDRAAIPDGRPGGAARRRHLDPDFRFHHLRHACASLLIEQGAHPKEIQARLGHSTITTTLDRYGHLMPGLGRSARGKSRRDAEESRSDVDQMWTNDDAEVIAFPEPEDENEELPAASEGGRYWVRTSDPCVVSAVLFR